jgi:hypothetical protein
MPRLSPRRYIQTFFVACGVEGDFAGGVTGALGCGFGGSGPIVTYGLSFSRRAFEMRRIASRSLTLRNWPLLLRNWMMSFAVTGPTPGNCSSCSIVAVFKLIGFAGGFFCVNEIVAPAAVSSNAIKTANGAKNLRFLSA